MYITYATNTITNQCDFIETKNLTVMFRFVRKYISKALCITICPDGSYIDWNDLVDAFEEVK